MLGYLDRLLEIDERAVRALGHELIRHLKEMKDFDIRKRDNVWILEKFINRLADTTVTPEIIKEILNLESCKNFLLQKIFFLG